MIYRGTKRTIGFPVGELVLPTYPMSEKFLEELNSMPPSAGIALGVDRLVMVFLNAATAATIDEVVAFTPEELSIICS